MIAAIRAIAERVARSYHLEVFDVQHRRESHGWVVRIFLDRPSICSASSGSRGAIVEPSRDSDAGVTIEDCERVSRDVSAVLDVEDVIDHAYTLEVSSPGLDRPLRRPDEYRRFAGRLAKIVVSEPVDNQKHLSGRLRGIEGDTVLLEGHGGRIHRVPMSVITRARLDVEF